MTNDLTSIKALIRDLAASIVTNPDKLRVEFQPTADGDCYFMMQGAPADESILIGLGGSHVQAITLLVDEIGTARRKNYTFRLLTTNDPVKREPGKYRDVIEYNPAPAAALITRLLDALEIKAGVAVGSGNGPRRSLTFCFTLATVARDGYETLTVPRGERETTIIGAIGTLFRAMAKRDGVRFDVVAEEPR